MDGTITEETIREHLNRILQTRAFSDSVVLTNFLTFIVNETLTGHSHELKEYTIGTNALKRDVDFNPQIDSIVRIHAGRLRRALKEYYYENGRDEQIEIVVPKGTYVPQFKASTGYNTTIELNENAKKSSRSFKTLHPSSKIS